STADHQDAVAWQHVLDLDQRLRTSSREDTRQRPARERYWPIVGTDCHDQALGAQRPRPERRMVQIDEERVRSPHVPDDVLGQDPATAPYRLPPQPAPKPILLTHGGRLTHLEADRRLLVDLAAERGALLNHSGLHAGPSSLQG